jgi:hypothetical protein
MRIPRFHPLICNYHGIVAWWVCDGQADTANTHTLAMPYITEPCIDRDESVALCAILNEEDAAGAILV